ncbi:LAME_0H14928g1_1 [Lachancea meyersii CBS 8951]|uniref:Ataxin-10 homolog n=1 Tax=Lachancea meyersii CBS 8951 TaxID=1266667 RepID=A0A1G4KHM3_9SACH|nr:LAME_0H14928g1_1 [Lachancea meyersii CBS 8951]
MSISEIVTLNNVASLLCGYPGGKELFEAIIPLLSSIVLKSSHDANYRDSLAKDEELWSAIGRCSRFEQFLTNYGGKMELRFWHLRTFRGVVLLARNLCVSNQELPQNLMLQYQFFRAFNSFKEGYQYDEMELSLFKTLTEFFCNVTSKSVVFDKSCIQDVTQFLCYPIAQNKADDVILSYTMLLRNLVAHDDFVYHFLKTDEATTVLHDFLLAKVCQDHTNIPKMINDKHGDNTELSVLGGLVMSIFMRLCSHESFAPYVADVEKSDQDKFMDFLNLSHLATTSSENWNNFQLTGIMTWCFRLLESLAADVQAYFDINDENESRAKFLHDRLLIVLDILTKLTQYEHVRKFMVFYKGVEVLVRLLHLFQEKLLRLNILQLTGQNASTLKVTFSNGVQISDSALIASRFDSTTGSIKATNFPECKLLIIETLSFLAYNNKDVQDKMRELQGLEAVLSNCVIDDNDPFIKERSIMCIKILLQDNPENQKIVAKLESKSAVHDETLSQAGYEVNVGKGGKIQIAPPTKH